MTKLILMYIYFDSDGDIKAISPARDDSMAPGCSVATFPLLDVELFLTGKRNTFDYHIKTIQKLAGVSYTIARKFNDAVYIRTLDNYITRISEKKKLNTIITLTNNHREGKFTIQLTPDFIDIIKDNAEETKDVVTVLLNSGSSNIYITRRGNPYALLNTISFFPKDLLEKELICFDYSTDNKESSAYTKKVVNGYYYEHKV